MLASVSPRRRQLLEQAGLRHRVVDVGFDDALIRTPRGLPGPVVATAMAWAKARAAERRLGWGEGEAILSADTVCELDGRILGKPSGPAEAESMLRSLAGRTHRTATAVCLLDPRRARRLLWSEAVQVRIGDLDRADIARYVESGGWRGKAGGYSFDERRAAGWPIECDGDPQVVLGLPTASVARRARELAAEAAR